MRTRTVHKSPDLSRWRAGIFPFVCLLFLCSMGFLVQLPMAVELMAIASETIDAKARQEAQTATTILMALGASAMLAGTMLWDRVSNRTYGDRHDENTRPRLADRTLGKRRWTDPRHL